MFGLYELLAIGAWCTLGYNAFFYAILAIVSNDIAERIGFRPALSIGAIGAYLIHFLGIFNLLTFAAVICTCIWTETVTAYITERAVELYGYLGTFPRGQQAITAGTFVYNTTLTTGRFIAGTSYVQPYTTAEGIRTLIATTKGRIYNAHLAIFELTTSRIRVPIIASGGVRAERILGCWTTIRREIETQIIIYRVKLAKVLLTIRKNYPLVKTGLIMAKNNPAMLQSMMGGMGGMSGMTALFAGGAAPTFPVATPTPVTQSPATRSQVRVRDASMDLMRDFIADTPTTSATTPTVVTATINTIAPIPTPVDGDISSAAKVQFRNMLLNMLQAQGVNWKTQTSKQRNVWIERLESRLSTITKTTGMDLPGINIAEILSA